MRIKKGTARFDKNTNEVVIDHLEMDSTQPGVLRLPVGLLQDLASMETTPKAPLVILTGGRPRVSVTGN